MPEKKKVPQRSNSKAELKKRRKLVEDKQGAKALEAIAIAQGKRPRKCASLAVPPMAPPPEEEE